MTTAKAAKKTPNRRLSAGDVGLTPQGAPTGEANAAEPIDSAGNLQLQSPPPGAPAPVKRRARRTKESAADMPDVEIPAELLSNPDKMNFTLLLALLSKMDGRVEFTAAQLDVDDTAYSIVFAKSLDGKKVVVSVVSCQSGILKTPSAEKGNIPSWTPSAPYTPPPTLAEMEEYWAKHPGAGAADQRALPTREEMLGAARAEPTPQEKFLQAAEAERQAATEAETRPPMPLPFSVGDSPQTSKPMDLGAYAQREISRSDQIAAEEASAAERVERGQ